ncbi:WxL domain-containing protein [Enterococcus faecalis]|uniref:WxL domain-containing protein n=1 Tax=Enterococcus faecalis TaxID=1351 RepID=UPI0015749393|nr:WxL domain-containing protein [Enterococcus faecalis]EGO8884516.1 WxL domain-containing protein [Enterococcus faecalis]EHQ8834336.1 WxL domain-containing protein [Enterococcus faecalis]EIB3067444.1 WxL domain-containing protein [Enterococcus faecalis]EIP8062008.1 WxL domain-containing protein [Enterococcus faecalis]MBO6370006.1 WxL domain-containing protein [Enterococcus faecalis]
MKKLFLGTSLLITSLFVSVQITHAETKSEAESKSTVKTVVGETTEPTPPVDPTDPEKPNPDPEVPGTGNTGPLTIDLVSNIEFGEQEIKEKEAIYNAKTEHPYVQITDRRGTGAGWTLKASIGEFNNEDKTKTLKGAEFSLKNGTIKSTSSNVSEKPQGYDVNLNKDLQVIMQAVTDQGMGTWLDVFSGTKDNNANVQLKVPAGSAKAKQSYSSVIHWELTDAPA